MYNGDGLQDPDSKYMMRLRSMMDDGLCRFLISISDLREWDRGLTAQLVASPMELVPMLEAAVKDVSAVHGVVC